MSKTTVSTQGEQVRAALAGERAATPRTDALRKSALDSNDLRAWQSLADTLERELANASSSVIVALERALNDESDLAALEAVVLDMRTALDALTIRSRNGTQLCFRSHNSVPMGMSKKQERLAKAALARADALLPPAGD